MSGIVGMLTFDGAPIDGRLLRRMSASMRYRGPDGEAIWIDGVVGFGHALLRVGRGSGDDEQPCSSDGHVWITADVSLDGRADLVRKLEAGDCSGASSACDARLILHAYDVWGEGCVDHLLGDFAFAIWDARARRLFCARDRFGVKPFYYAHLAARFIFSNTLNCVRLHPLVSGELNERTIGDFLLFGYNQDVETTTFADIRRLPPAHTLSVCAGDVRVRRYWSPGAGTPIRYRRGSDYVDHFNQLWETAVADRLPAAGVGVLMSGGLDSTSVAVTAHHLLSARREPAEVRAHTLVYDRLIPHEERRFSDLAASAVGIPIEYVVADEYTLFDRCDDAAGQTPEPCDNPVPALTVDVFARIARRSRLVLTGEGGDAALAPPPSCFATLLRAGRLGTLAGDVVRCLGQGQRPPLGIRSTLRRWRGMAPEHPACPVWLAPSFAARMDLRRRLAEVSRAAEEEADTAAASWLQAPFWSSLLESYDPGITQSAVEVRHPFFDVRLLTFLAAIPPIPWRLDKKLLRAAMRGRLPEPVRRRPKAPVRGEPVSALLRQHNAGWVNHIEPTPELLEYVDARKIPKVAGLRHEMDAYETAWHLITRPLCLNHWLAQACRAGAQGAAARVEGAA